MFAKVISALCSIRRSFSKERASPSHQLNCAAMQDPNWRLCKEVLATNVRQVLSTGQITFFTLTQAFSLHPLGRASSSVPGMEPCLSM